MNLLKVYKIISYILLPFAVLFGLADLIMLPLALTNVATLLPVFLLACVVIYIFSSFVFLQKGILPNRTVKRSLKDWIHVNAIVSAAFCLLNSIQMIQLFVNPQVSALIVQKAMEMSGGNLPANYSNSIEQIFKGTMIFMAIFFGLLAIHLIISFRFLKTYKHLFLSSNE